MPKLTNPTVTAGTLVSTSQGFIARFVPETWVSGTRRYASTLATTAKPAATTNAVAMV